MSVKINFVLGVAFVVALSLWGYYAAKQKVAERVAQEAVEKEAAKEAIKKKNALEAKKVAAAAKSVADHGAKMTDWLVRFEAERPGDLREEELGEVIREFCLNPSLVRSEPIGKYVKWVDVDYSAECIRAVTVTRSQNPHSYGTFQQNYNCDVSREASRLRITCHGSSYPLGLLP